MLSIPCFAPSTKTSSYVWNGYHKCGPRRSMLRASWCDTDGVVVGAGGAGSCAGGGGGGVAVDVTVVVVVVVLWFCCSG